MESDSKKLSYQRTRWVSRRIIEIALLPILLIAKSFDGGQPCKQKHNALIFLNLDFRLLPTDKEKKPLQSPHTNLFKFY